MWERTIERARMCWEIGWALASGLGRSFLVLLGMRHLPPGHNRREKK